MRGGGESVCVFGHSDPEYSRQRILREGLEAVGILFVDCMVHGPEFEAIRRHRGNVPYLLRVCRALRESFRRCGGDRSGVLFVCATNHAVMPLAWLLAKRHRMRLLYDAFDSVYYAVRQASSHRTGRVHPWLVYLVEWLALHLADVVLVLNEFYGEYYARNYGLRLSKMRTLLLGASPTRFGPHVVPGRFAVGSFNAVYWGNFLVHHGVPVIVEAARLLQAEPDIRIHLVGDGVLRQPCMAEAERLGLTNVTFHGRLSDADLGAVIADSQVCLGVFSSEAKALISVTNKVFEGMSLGKAIVTERSRATERFLRDGATAVLVPPEDPGALAAAIRCLRDDPDLCRRLGATAQVEWRRHYSPRVIGAQLAAVIAGEAAG